MAFFIPAETVVSVSIGGFPPSTGYFPVTITKFEDRGTKDKQGNYSYFIHLQFPDGSTTREIGSCPFDSDGKLAASLAAMGEDDRKKKINGMVGALKRVALSSGLTADYMAENGLATEYLEGRTAYIAWLGRPADVPAGQKVYGEVQNFITEEAFAAFEAKGTLPTDPRQFPWRRGTGQSSGGGNTAAPANAAGAKLPPPPTSAGRAKLPPPPTR